MQARQHRKTGIATFNLTGPGIRLFNLLIENIGHLITGIDISVCSGWCDLIKCQGSSKPNKHGKKYQVVAILIYVIVPKRTSE